VKYALITDGKVVQTQTRPKTGFVQVDDTVVPGMIQQADGSFAAPPPPPPTWDEIREKRDQLLADTDWTQGNDTPLSPELVAAFAAYRQALRDLPQTYANPGDVVWPEKPAND